MNEKEEQLEEISQKVDNYKPIKQPPIFEMYITMVSLALAIAFFLFPDMMINGADGGVHLYVLILTIMPQWMWAFTFTGAGLIKAIGMLVDKKYLRITGLILSAFIYAVFAISYTAATFPSIGSIIFTGMAIFALLNIPEVKKTGLDE